MNSLILQLKIEATKQEKKLEDFKIKLLRLMHELQNAICPYFETIDEIRADEIKQIGEELLLTKKEALEVDKKLKRIKAELGED